MNISRCRIIAVGKVRKGWVQEGVALYLKRLQGLQVVELKDSTPEKEAEAIRSTLRADEWPVMLMEQGTPLASIPFAQRLERLGNERLALSSSVSPSAPPITKARRSLPRRSSR